MPSENIRAAQSGGAQTLPTLAYTIDETAEVLKVHRSYVYKMLGEHRLESITLGRRRLVKASSVHKLFDEAA